MNDSESNKAVVLDMIEAIWRRADLGALGRYWTTDCINHAAAPGRDRGLTALDDYHRDFAAQLSGFTDVRIEVLQQIAEGNRVVTHLMTEGTHSGDFAGVAATGRPVRLATIRIDRLVDGRIAEHWSVAVAVADAPACSAGCGRRPPSPRV